MGYIVEEAQKIEKEIENIKEGRFRSGMAIGYAVCLKQMGATWEELAEWMHCSVGCVRQHLKPHLDKKDYYDF